MRETIPPAVRKGILARDNNRCRKCGSERGLDVHHIKAIADGGDNAESNLETLCNPCHREWHMFMEGVTGIEHDSWLLLPHGRQIVKILLDDSTSWEGLTASQFRESLYKVASLYRDGIEYEYPNGRVAAYTK